MKSGIYKILNLVSGKFYIGSAVNIANRWRGHEHSLKNLKHKNNFLQASWNLHGEAAFTFEIIELCEKERLIEREQHWLDTTKCYDRSIGYNLNKVAGNMLGYRHSEETKLKFKNRVYTEKIKSNMAKGQIGKKYSEETKLKLGLKRKGRIVSEKVKAHVSSVHKGKTLSQETKALISAANKGRKISSEAIAKREASRARNRVINDQ